MHKDGGNDFNCPHSAGEVPNSSYIGIFPLQGNFLFKSWAITISVTVPSGWGLYQDTIRAGLLPSVCTHRVGLIPGHYKSWAITISVTVPSGWGLYQDTIRAGLLPSVCTHRVGLIPGHYKSWAITISVFPQGGAYTRTL